MCIYKNGTHLFIKVIYICRYTIFKIKYLSGQIYVLKSSGVASGRMPAHAHMCGLWASVPSWRFVTKTPVLEASPSRHKRLPRAVWPGGALCSWLALSSSRGQRSLLQCSVASEPELLWHLSPRCHWPQVGLSVAPAVPRGCVGAQRHWSVYSAFPMGLPCCGEDFYFLLWQVTARVCVCVCQPEGLSHSPPSAQGQRHFPFPGGVRCKPVSTGHLTSLYFVGFFFFLS